MADIFISHIHEEGAATKALTDYLKGYGLESFVSSDNSQILLGERWFDRITAELEAAKIVILMLSKQSVARPWINFEAGWSWSKGKITIPACFGGLRPGEMPRPYSDLQGFELATGAYTLVLDCHRHLNRFSPPPVYEDTGAREKLVRVLKAIEEGRTIPAEPIRPPSS